MKRRTALMALGALATGSGAVATTAAITGTAETGSNINVVVEEELEVVAGNAFFDDGSVKPSYDTGQYVSYTDNDEFFGNQSKPSTNPLVDISRDDLPVATVSPRTTTTNSELELRVGLSIENGIDTTTFEDFLTIRNTGGDEKLVGITYDRDLNQYGEDVIVGGSYQDELSQHDAQHIYRFQTSNPATNGKLQISPDPTTNSDDPAEFRVVDPGDAIQVDLQGRLDPLTDFVVNLDPKDHIRQQLDTTGGFGDSIEAVDLLNGLRVVNEANFN